MKSTPPTSWAVELRLALIEMVLTAIFVFLSAGATATALWSCVTECASAEAAKHHGMDSHTTKGTTVMGTMNMSEPSMGMPSMRRALATADMAMGPMCPPPTVAIIVGLVTGFAAAVVNGMSHAGHGGHADGVQAIDAACHSGGYVSPSVTAGYVLRGQVPAVRLLTFTIGQLVGASIGGGLLAGVLGRSCLETIFSTAGFDEGGIGLAEQLLLNTILSTMLTLLHLFCVRVRAMALPVLVGFFYIAATMLSYPMDHMGSFNPLRDFGVVAAGPHHREGQWLWWAAALLGGAAGAFIDALLFEPALWHKCGAYALPKTTAEAKDAA